MWTYRPVVACGRGPAGGESWWWFLPRLPVGDSLFLGRSSRLGAAEAPGWRKHPSSVGGGRHTHAAKRERTGTGAVLRQIPESRTHAYAALHRSETTDSRGLPPLDRRSACTHAPVKENGSMPTVTVRIIRVNAVGRGYAHGCRRDRAVGYFSVSIYVGGRRHIDHCRRFWMAVGKKGTVPSIYRR